MIHVYISGRHKRRLPLSYSALAPLFHDHIVLVERPEDADLYLFAHVLDLEEAAQEVIADWRRRRRPVVLLSEEPFWDTIWGRRPLQGHLEVETRFGTVPVIQLNHQTSDIFRFDAIPYYLLTNHRFATRYLHRFRRNEARSAQQWRAAFEARSRHLTFMFERRPEAFHNVRWEADSLIGLCAWRTELAECFDDDDSDGNLGTGAERLGQSWQGGKPRFDLPDWHLDKIMRLDDHCRILSAIENTHQPNYISEKFFDAFACGAMPLYYATPEHRIHDFDLPAESWLNLSDLSPDDAAEQVRAQTFDAAFFEAFREAQHLLANLFSDTDLLVAERERLGQSVQRALRQALEDAS